MKLRLGLVALLLAFPGALRAQDGLPDGEAKKVVERVCTECHGTDEITSIKRTPDQWRRLVKDMVDRRETRTSDEEVKQIIDYLIAHFSRPDSVQPARPREASRLSAQGSGLQARLLSVPLGSELLHSLRVSSRRYTCTTIFSTDPKPRAMSLKPAGCLFQQPASKEQRE
jgi:hypothetical protein